MRKELCAIIMLSFRGRKEPSKWPEMGHKGREQPLKDIIYLMLLSRSFSDHHLRCGGWLNFEFSKRGKTFGMGY